MNAQQKKLIEQTRAKVQSLAAEQDALYSNMIRELRITEDPLDAGDWLWDYVFNCEDNDTTGYTQRVRENIFGKEEV